MFQRPESLRERTLLRLIEQQQVTIRDLTDRLMHVTSHTWTLPPLPENTKVPDVTPREWTENPSEEPVY